MNTVGGAGISKYLIRRAIEKDAGVLFDLVKELSVYESTPELVKTSKEDFLKFGFGEKPEFTSFVVEHEHEVIGLITFYMIFKAYYGPYGFIDTLFVREKHRGIGLGKALMRAAAKACLEAGYATGLSWDVLGWNKQAIQLYDTTGAENIQRTRQWEVYQMKGEEQIREFAYGTPRKREGIEIQMVD